MDLSHDAALVFADAIVGEVRRVVGGRLVAAYVVGSLAGGDATPPTSDIDMLVVVDRRLRQRTAERLGESLVARSADCPWACLELVVYERDVLARPRHPLPYELNVNAGGKRPVHVSTEGDPAHWFLLDVAMARENAVTRFGPPPGSVIGEPPRADVVAAIRESLRWLRRNESGSPNSVLNACRGWHFAATSRWVSKREAGEWALRHSQRPAVVRAALDARGRPGGGPLSAHDVADFLATVDELIAGATPTGL